MLPWSVTEKILRDSEEMRAFYKTLGLRPDVIERAAEARLKPQIDDRGRGGMKKRGRPRSSVQK
jgi:hypothetical protein